MMISPEVDWMGLGKLTLNETEEDSEEKEKCIRPKVPKLHKEGGVLPKRHVDKHGKEDVLQEDVSEVRPIFSKVTRNSRNL